MTLVRKTLVLYNRFSISRSIKHTQYINMNDLGKVKYLHTIALYINDLGKVKYLHTIAIYKNDLGKEDICLIESKATLLQNFNLIHHIFNVAL